MPIDFSYLEGAAPQKESTPTKSDTANVTIRVDADSMLLCDGEYIEQPFKAGVISKIQLPLGQHLLEFHHTEDPDIKIEKEVDFPEAGKSYLVLIKGLKDLIDAAEEEAKQNAAAAEARRKAKEEAEQKAAEEEARRKAEEEAEIKKEAQRLAEKESNNLYDVVLVQGHTGFFQQMAFKKILEIGLKEAHELIHSAPCIIKKSISKSEAEAIKKQIEKEASAEVIIK